MSTLADLLATLMNRGNSSEPQGMEAMHDMNNDMHYNAAKLISQRRGMNLSPEEQEYHEKMTQMLDNLKGKEMPVQGVEIPSNDNSLMERMLMPPVENDPYQKYNDALMQGRIQAMKAINQSQR